MSGVAAHVAQYGRRWPRLSAMSAAPRGGGIPGTPILQDSFGTDLNLVVEVAWGANPLADSTSWRWSDITSDVLVDNGKKISITPGRADEASIAQPAQMTCVLKNKTGAYSYGGQSPNYPNVQKGVPVRVRVFLSGVPYVRFQGNVVGLTPEWDVTGNYAIVTLTAAGVRRRATQGVAPDQSPLKRATLATLPVIYWPLEDPAGSTQGAAATIQHGSADVKRSYNAFAYTPGTGTSSIQYAAAADLAGSAPLPVITGAGTGQGQPVYIGNFYQQETASGWTVGWAQKCDSDTTAEVDLQFNSFANFMCDVYFGTTNIVVQDDVGGGTVMLTIPTPANFFGQWHYFHLSVQGPTSSFVYKFYIDGVLYGPAGITHNNSGVGIWQVVVNAPTVKTMAIGHVAIWAGDVTPAILNLAHYALGFPGELVTDRLNRLAADQNQTMSIVGTSDMKMGAQLIDTPANLFQQCAEVDGGFLFDGLAAGQTYVTRAHRENQTASLVLDATNKDLAFPLKPVDDDLLVKNTWTVSRAGGGTARFQLQTGPAGSNTIGTYESSITLNTQDDTSLVDQAGWRVNLGTQSEYRYPTLQVALHRIPGLVSSWLNTGLTSRITVKHLHNAYGQALPADIDLILEGYTETFDKFLWDVQANCSPFVPWRIATIAQDVGDTSEFAFRLESDGASVAAGGGQSAPGWTSVPVTTPSGPLWTQNADDFPFVANIGGLPVTVTAIGAPTGTTQVFTVDPTTTLFPVADGASVSLWNQPVLGL